MRSITPSAPFSSFTHLPFSLSPLLFLFFVAMVCFTAACAPATDSQNSYTSWTRYEGQPEATTYSALDQVNRSNVDQLEIAWTYSPGHVSDFVPIVVDSVMYLLYNNETITALHAATGKEIWSRLIPSIPGLIRTRGFSYWENSNRTDRRLIFPKGNFHLVAMDAQTGDLISSFGDNGSIDLRNGLGVEPDVVVRATSGVPGVIFEDLIVLGSSPGEGYTSAPGHIRAFNVRTGQQEWIFHTLPQPGEYGYETWPPGRSDNDNISSESARGGVNAWGGLSVDPVRGIVYVPLGSASYDFYGVDRLGENLFANSLVALDARTGERIWHFQTIHHDLWDYDLASTPVLLTVDHEGEEVDIVAVAAKTGMLFVFDRETGTPLWPIEERPVPASEMPGEEAWPTQPFPTRPEPFIPQTFDLETDLNPYLLASERDSIVEAVRGMIYKGIFTPPDIRPTFQIPGNLGGGNWGSSAGDPGEGTFYIMSRNKPSVLELQQITAGRAGTGASPIDNGQILYQQYCLVCHGSDFQGQPAAGFPSLQDVTNRLSNAEFVQITRNGGTRMPSFLQLEDEDIDALQMYLANPQLALNSVEESSSTGPVRYQSGYNHITDSKGVPVIKPPWTRLTAYDLNAGTIKWQVPVGEMPHLAEQGITNTGMGNLNGGPAVTAGGLIFQAAGDKLWAYDKDTGAVLWSGLLPANGKGIPAIYEVDGRQYIVISAPGERIEVEGQVPAFVAFALPE